LGRIASPGTVSSHRRHDHSIFQLVWAQLVRREEIHIQLLVQTTLFPMTAFIPYSVALSRLCLT
jgi:hypothetical protein